QGEAGHRDDADRVGPGLAALLAPTEVVDEVGGRAGAARVVPQQRRADHLAVLVQDHHAVLLPGDRYRGDVVQPAGLVDRLAQRVPPGVRVHLGAVRMAGAPLTYELARLRVPNDDLAGLGGAVDPGYESHGLPQFALRMWSMASWFSATKP